MSVAGPRTVVHVPPREKAGPRTRVHLNPRVTALQGSVELVGKEVLVRWTGVSGAVTIFLRRAGESDWGNPIYSGNGGLLPAGQHFIRVQDLEPGVEYEFRITA